MGPSLLRPILVRAASLGAVLVIVLFLLVVTLGATGFSDRILSAQVDEQLRALRIGLSDQITDPAAIEEAISTQRAELEASFGLDREWYERMPALVAQVMTFDLGESRSIRSFEGSNDVADIVLERLPNTIILLTTALAINAIIGLSVGVWLSQRPGSRATASSPTSRPSRTGCRPGGPASCSSSSSRFWLRILPDGGMSQHATAGGLHRPSVSWTSPGMRCYRS